MQKRDAPADAEELHLSAPGLWPFVMVYGPAEAYIVRGAAIPFIRARKKFGPKLQGTPLVTKIRIRYPISHRVVQGGKDSKHRIEHLLTHDAEGDVRAWLECLYRSLTTILPRQRLIGLNVQIQIGSPLVKIPSVTWNNHWW